MMLQALLIPLLVLFEPTHLQNKIKMVEVGLAATFIEMGKRSLHKIYFLYVLLVCLHSAHCTIKWAIKFN